MINCKYPKIQGGVKAVIEEGERVLVSRKFQELNDAINWTNSWVEGYDYGNNN